MRYSVIQPQYFPRLHYFARILATDIFMIRDDAQYVRKHKYPDGRVDKSFQSHTPIKQSFGVQLLAVPTKRDGFSPLTETKISYDHDWVETHLKTLQVVYSKSDNFESIYPEIKKIIKKPFKNLVELNNTTIFWGVLRLLGKESIEIKDLTFNKVNERLKKQNEFRLKDIKRATETKSFRKFKDISPNEKIIAMCKELGADEDYCGGTGATAYMDQKIFSDNGIKITVQDWECGEYPQLFTKQQGFIPNLSIIDLIMNVPAAQAAEIIKG